MSTARRRLGTGPSSNRNTPTTETSPQLPAERDESDALLGEVEHQDVSADRKGRRNLGLAGSRRDARGGVVAK
ncbi:hypothetical protein [Streptomyces massasporeus]|uniref:hypothetical protein n=1 Tax=Streptomyces massasporeus TaxID=67324 RepID=UPI0033CEFB36